MSDPGVHCHSVRHAGFSWVNLTGIERPYIGTISEGISDVLTGIFPDLFPNAQLLALRTLLLLIGVIIAICFCIIQIHSYVMRVKKQYSVESVWFLVLKPAVISPAIVWLFYVLALYRECPWSLLSWE